MFVYFSMFSHISLYFLIFSGAHTEHTDRPIGSGHWIARIDRKNSSLPNEALEKGYTVDGFKKIPPNIAL